MEDVGYTSTGFPEVAEILEDGYHEYETAPEAVTVELSLIQITPEDDAEAETTGWARTTMVFVS